MTVKTVRSFCRVCTSVCGILVDVDGDDVVRVRGDQDRVRAIIEEHGPAAVGIFFGSGNGMDAAGYRMAQALHAAIGTPAKFSPLTIDGTAKVLISDLVGGAVALSGRPGRPRPDHGHDQVFGHSGDRRTGGRRVATFGYSK
jgi:molybdopterin-dependent oxidoreductase iron-sulfur protein